MTIGNASDGMPQNLYGRFGDMLVVVSRTGFPQILERPLLFLASFDIRLRCEISHRAKFTVSRTSSAFECVIRGQFDGDPVLCFAK